MRQKAFLNCLAAFGVVIGIVTQLARPVTQAFTMDDTSIIVPVLMYHHVTNDPTYWGNDSISAEEFESDLKTIKKLGYNTVSLSQLYEYVSANGSLPLNPIVITFDDGFLNYKDVVVPLLEKYNCRATLAVTGEFADNAEQRKTDDPDFEYLKWSEIAELDTYHTEIAYHSYYSHKIKDKNTGRKGMKKRFFESKKKYREYLNKELMLFNEKLKELSMHTFITVYPYGFYSRSTDEILTSMGINITLTTDGGVNEIRRGDESSLFSLKRINRPHGVNSEVFLSQYLN